MQGTWENGLADDGRRSRRFVECQKGQFGYTMIFTTAWSPKSGHIGCAFTAPLRGTPKWAKCTLLTGINFLLPSLLLIA